MKNGPLRKFLSTLPVRGATISREPERLLRKISIHAPREGSDSLQKAGAGSARISIHAPREGSDSGASRPGIPPCNFYPRSPRGERRDELKEAVNESLFLSTLPARGAT